MRYYPIHLDMKGRNAVVIGGGSIAEAKIVPLVGAGAIIKVVSPELTPKLSELARRNEIVHVERAFEESDLDGASLVISATDNRTLNEQVSAAARRSSIWCNVVDQPDICDFITPALVERGDLQIGISTAGGSPVLAQRVKREVAELVTAEYGELLTLAAEMRARAKQAVPDFTERRDLLRAFVESDALDLLRVGKRNAAQAIADRLLAPFEVREGDSVDDVVKWAADRFGAGLVMTSNFGAEGVVLIDHLARIAPRTPVIYIDTGFQFAATDELKEELRARYDLNIVEVRSRLTVEEQANIYGERLFARDPDLCCRLRKVDPLGEALSGKRAWLTALRRDSSPSRSQLKPVEWSSRYELIKINPLCGWTKARVWDYISKHKLPYNRLYDEGYASIGCEPCTRKVAEGAHERSGRWDGLEKLECGIHL
jgi:phosphoadenosine phosphosulfate reductase